MMRPRIENGRWCCPSCWTRKGLWMPFLEGQDCICGYEFPTWVMPPEKAYEKAQRLAAEGAFDVILDAKPEELDRHDLVFDPRISKFYFAGLIFHKL